MFIRSTSDGSGLVKEQIALWIRDFYNRTQIHVGILLQPLNGRYSGQQWKCFGEDVLKEYHHQRLNFNGRYCQETLHIPSVFHNYSDKP